MLEPSGACVSLIKRSESCRLTAYQDPGGVWTIGWGHTAPSVKAGLVITQAWADWLLRMDVKQAARAVENLTAGVELSQGEVDGLTSFVFNLGGERLAGSTLLKKLKLGDRAGAADEFLKWVYERKGGEEVEASALLERRQAERRLFLGAA